MASIAIPEFCTIIKYFFKPCLINIFKYVKPESDFNSNSSLSQTFHFQYYINKITFSISFYLKIKQSEIQAYMDVHMYIMHKPILNMVFYYLTWSCAKVGKFCCKLSNVYCMYI